MKQVLVICAAVAATCALGLTSCEKKGNGRLDPNAMLSIRPAAGVPIKSAAEANPAHLSALEIVKQTKELRFWDKSLRPDAATGRGFSDAQRDYEQARLLMLSSDVIDTNGDLNLGFIVGRDCILIKRTSLGIDIGSITDTIAYIPNSIMIAAEAAIKEAFAKGDYESCYSLFDQAFRFTPITGAEWRALKEAGNN